MTIALLLALSAASWLSAEWTYGAGCPGLSFALRLASGALALIALVLGLGELIRIA